VDFVVARGPALHRSAVLLTHQEQAAQDLVQIALAKAWQSWARIDGNYEADVRRIMVNEFTSSRRPRRWLGWRWWRGRLPRTELPERPLVPRDDDGGDVGDVVSMHRVLMAALALLPPRQRAVVVLRFFHDCTEAATAEAMGIRVGTVNSQTLKALAALRVFEELRDDGPSIVTGPAQAGDAPLQRTLNDLRGALQEQADAVPYPALDSLVTGARRRVAANRRRRLTVLGATTVAVLVVGGLLANTSSARKVSPQTAAIGPFTVNAGSTGFPEYDQGRRRLLVLDAPMLERVKEQISVPTTPGRPLWVRMKCTPTLGDWDGRMLARFIRSGRTVSAQCTVGYLSLGSVIEAKSTVLADVFISHEPRARMAQMFKNAKIQVAFYESVPWEDYRFPARPADLDTDPQYAWPSEPGALRVLGPKTMLEANQPLTFTQPCEPLLVFKLQARGPGRMQLVVDGLDVSRWMEDPWPVDPSMSFLWSDDPWSQDRWFEDPWRYAKTFWEYTRMATTYSLPTCLATKPGTPMKVRINPEGFQGPDWRIVVEPPAPNGG